MSKRYLQNTDRSTGLSFDEKRGVEGSFAYSQNMEFRASPNKVLLHNIPYREAELGVIYDSTRNAKSAGDTYWAAGTKIYKRVPETRGNRGTWSTFSSDANLIKARGILFKNDMNAMLVTDETYVHRIKNCDTTPTMEANKYGQLQDLKVTITSTGNYTVTASVTETAAHQLPFTPNIEPFVKLQIGFGTKVGVGDLTAILHDDANNELGRATIANASLVNSSTISFNFSPQVRLYAKPNQRKYHFHLTSSTAHTIPTSAADNGLYGCAYTTFADRLVASDYHPIEEFLHYVVIGNERYLTVWEPISDNPTKTEWLSHRLTFPSNYTTIGLAQYDEFLAVAAYKKKSADYGSQFGKSATEGIIFFWDGVSDTYNYYIRIPEGAPESLMVYKNVLYYIADGSLYAYAGGQPVMVRTLPGIDNFNGLETHTEDVYLQAPYRGMTIRDNILHIGYPMKSVNSNLKMGIYTWGTKDKNFKDSFGYSHKPLYGNQMAVDTVNDPTVLEPKNGITHVKAYGQNLFMCYSFLDATNTVKYAIEVISKQNTYPTTGSEGIIENLVYDAKRPWKDKLATYYNITIEPLQSGSAITPKYKIDRAANWTYGTTVSTVGTVEVRQHINKRFKEIQTGYEITGGNNNVAVTSDTLFFDNLEEEAI